jgi:SpoVK/Ycf46/Vps4 family AAA+-type ATPase
VEDGVFSADDLRHVLEAKKGIIEKDGLLEYYPADNTLSDIAGLDGLKNWLGKRREFFSSPDAAAAYGLPFPKGILLTGVQGCGKSLCARAVASEWRLPLLRLDPSRLYDKYIGETEKNFLRAMKIAEKVAPVVLWIDELEKAFAASSQSDDGGVSMRIMGSFLSWLSDRKADVFVVATANQIEMLPPEFVRKGRFDEIFFVNLPKPSAREKLFEIHLKKRGRKPEEFNLPALAAASADFSGAEIEQSVVSALYTAFSRKASLNQEILLAEIAQTRPLAVTMGEKVRVIREWAKTRTVAAD